MSVGDEIRKNRNPIRCIKITVLFWCERGDLPAFFRREDAAFDGSWLRAKKSRYSPVCALVHAQPTGLCGHDSSLPDIKKKNHLNRWFFFLVRERRLELPRRLTHAPQTCLSTCSSTLAYIAGASTPFKAACTNWRAAFKAWIIIAGFQILSSAFFPASGVSPSKPVRKYSPAIHSAVSMAQPP